MDEADLHDLDAAIAAHCMLLEAANVELTAAPQELLASHLLNVVFEDSDKIAAVVTSLMALCALRTRRTIRTARRNQVDRPGNAAARRRAALITDDRHLERLSPSLKHLAERLRTAVRTLARFENDVLSRHQKFARLGISQGSGAPVDAALIRWLMSRCQSLELDIDFFTVEMEGPVAMPPIGHAGPADGKAWRRVRGDALVTLEKGGLTSRERRSLFPPSFQKKSDMGDDYRPRNRERKERERAKRRPKSKS